MASRIVLNNINSIRNRLANPHAGLVAVGEYIVGVLLKNWNEAKGGDGSKLRKLSEPYRRKKLRSGRLPIPNMNWSGQLTQSIKTVKRSRYLYVVTATGARAGSFAGATNLDVLRRQCELRDNLLELNENTRRHACRVFVKYALGGVR